MATFFIPTDNEVIEDYILSLKNITSTENRYIFGERAIELSQLHNCMEKYSGVSLSKGDTIYIPDAEGEQSLFDKAFFANEKTDYNGNSGIVDFGVVCCVHRSYKPIGIPLFFSKIKIHRIATLNPNTTDETPDEKRNYPLEDDFHSDWNGKGLMDSHNNANIIVSQFNGSVYLALKQLAGYTLKVVNCRTIRTWGQRRNGEFNALQKKVYDLMIISGPKYSNEVQDIHNVTFFIDDRKIAQYPFKVGAIVFSPEAEKRDNYQFTGWEHCPLYMPDADLFIYGNYKKNIFQVTYILDGETFMKKQAEAGSQLCKYDVPQKRGHIFSGWEDMPETMPNNDLVLNGHYMPLKYKITYLINERKYAEQNILFDSVIRPIPVPEDQKGYHWDGLPLKMDAMNIQVKLVKD